MSTKELEDAYRAGSALPGIAARAAELQTGDWRVIDDKTGDSASLSPDELALIREQIVEAFATEIPRSILLGEPLLKRD